MGAGPPDYFEPERGVVLTPLLIVRDVIARASSTSGCSRRRWSVSAGRMCCSFRTHPLGPGLDAGPTQRGAHELMTASHVPCEPATAQRVRRTHDEPMPLTCRLARRR